MTNDLIEQARRRYLTENPLRMRTLEAASTSGESLGCSIAIPDIGDIQVIGCKLGMEYLAICHDDYAVEQWVHTAVGIAKDPETVGILLANVFRGVNVVIGTIIGDAGLREQMEKLALDAWGRDFGVAS